MNRTQHFCERQEFNRKRELPKDASGHEHAYEVIDTHRGEPDNDCIIPDCDDCRECILLTDSKEEANALIQGNHFRYELIQNGVCMVCEKLCDIND